MIKKTATAAVFAAFCATFFATAGHASILELSADMTERRQMRAQGLMVHPIYESKSEVLFTQNSISSEKKWNTMRYVSNTSLGYRNISRDGQSMWGLNAFLDYGWKRQHTRVGLGFEAFQGPFSFTGNYYNGVSSLKTIGTTTPVAGTTITTTEQAMTGFDLELSSQVPYTPWATVHLQHFKYFGLQGTGASGWIYSAELAVLPTVFIEPGYIANNNGAGDWTIEGRWQIPIGGHAQSGPSLWGSGQPFSKSMWRKKSLRGERLKRIRRNNDVQVERVVTTTTGATSTQVITSQ